MTEQPSGGAIAVGQRGICKVFMVSTVVTKLQVVI